MRIIRIVAAFVVGAAVGLPGNLAWSQGSGSRPVSLDVPTMLEDVQQMKVENGRTALILWAIPDFWRASLEQAPGSPEERAEFLEVINRHAIFVVVEEKKSGLFGPTYETEEAVRDRIRLRTGGVSYKPVAADEIDAETRMLLEILKPTLAQLLGPLGESMHIVLFPATDAAGDRIADPRYAGAVTVELGTIEFNWRLPLGSLLPPKICPHCKERHSGAYKFCPHDATELAEESPRNLAGRNH